jgi:cation diffusion facilitator CzcD-associated flavoprotein CzcO
VPSHVYSYSFEPNPDWSRVFSPQEEILAYFEGCADKYGLRPHIRNGVEIASSVYDEERAEWTLETATGERFAADVVVSAVGALHYPKFPDIPGRDSFSGTQFHSAAWKKGHDVSGERVAIIGSAASAVQIVPQLQPKCREIKVFQRTPNWIFPRPDRAYSALEKWAFRWIPGARWLHRKALYWYMESRWPAFKIGSRASRAARKLALDHMKAQVSDPALREKLTPDYPVGCKRILLTDDFLPAIQAENAELVTDRIARIVPEGVELTSGRVVEVDTIVYATGYDIEKTLTPIDVTGKNGVTLKDAWAEEVGAHRGVAVPGFPNWFFLLGPNTGLGHNSIIYMTERQVNYVTQLIERMRDEGLSAVEPTREAFEAYNADIGRSLKKTVWSHDCGAWYRADGGKGRNFVLYPYSTVRYWWEMRHPDADEFVTQARVDA